MEWLLPAKSRRCPFLFGPRPGTNNRQASGLLTYLRRSYRPLSARSLGYTWICSGIGRSIEPGGEPEGRPATHGGGHGVLKGPDSAYSHLQLRLLRSLQSYDLAGEPTQVNSRSTQFDTAVRMDWVAWRKKGKETKKGGNGRRSNENSPAQFAWTPPAMALPMRRGMIALRPTRRGRSRIDRTATRPITMGRRTPPDCTSARGRVRRPLAAPER